jgi:hypothetical protein
MINIQTIEIPTEGINAADSPIAIGDYQALNTGGFRVAGTALESIRPQTNGLKHTVAANPSGTENIMVYRKKSGAVQYLYANSAKVYKGTALDGSAGTEITAAAFTSGSYSRISFIQFNDLIYMFNGISANKIYDGTTVYDMGYAPTELGTLPNPFGGLGSDTVDYYFTYYNPTLDIETNPSKVKRYTQFNGGNQDVWVPYLSNTQLTHVRLYRTGNGVVEPRLTGEYQISSYTNEAGFIHVVDATMDIDLAQANRLRFDRDKPPILVGGILHNNRLFAHAKNGDTVWVSNEGEPHYMPIFPFTDQENISSGGPIDINPGDGGSLQGLASWNGSVYAFKDNVVYRIDETEVGFYGYQTTNMPGLVGPSTLQVTPWGLIYLSTDGFVLCKSETEFIQIGYPILSYTAAMTATDRYYSAGIYSQGHYIVTLLDNAVGATGARTFVYDGSGWFGPTWSLDFGGSSWYEDIDGVLYVGKAYGGYCGIDVTHFHETGTRTGASHSAIGLAWRDKAREYNPMYYSRIREIRVIGKILTSNPPDNILYTLNVYNSRNVKIATKTFYFPQDGEVKIGIPSGAHAQYLSVEVIGSSITLPVQIFKIRAVVEQGAMV